MSLNAKFSDLLNKILSVKDEDEGSISKVESRANEDAALKQEIECLESQELARKRKLEAATENSNKLCLDLQVDALSKSSDLRLPEVLREAHVEALMKEKSALQEDIRGMKIKKKDFLAELQSLTLEADKLCSDKVDEKSSEQDETGEAEFAALAARLEAAQEKDLILTKAFEETATVLLRDQNDIKHILDDLKNWRKKGELLRRTSELADFILSEDDIKPEIVENAAKDSSTAASNTIKMKMLQCDKEIEAKMNRLMTAMVRVNKLLERERQTRKQEKTCDEAGIKLEEDSHAQGGQLEEGE